MSTFSTSERQKRLKTLSFYTFDLEMCFAPQRRALFRHRNIKKRSVPHVFCAFSLENVLRASTACTFSTSQQSGPNLVCFVHFDLDMCFALQGRALFRHLRFQICARTACNFSSLIWPAGSAPAALARLLFDPLEPQIIGKTQ